MPSHLGPEDGLSADALIGKRVYGDFSRHHRVGREREDGLRGEKVT
jgi:hypothetical protein